jgi:hypothetical protein
MVVTKFEKFGWVSEAEDFAGALSVDVLTMDNLVVGKVDWLAVVGKIIEVLENC